MSFEAKTIFESDFSESAQRFARDIGQEMGDAKLTADTRVMFESRWQQAIEQGWHACLIPENLGGLGGTLTDFCSLVEAASRYALRLPVATGFGVPAILLQAIDSDPANELLQSVASGQTCLQPAILDLQACDLRAGDDTLSARVTADGTLKLHGTISGIEQIPGATDILLVCPLAGQPSSYVIALVTLADASQIRAQAERIDGRTTLSLVVDQHTLQPFQILAQGQQATNALIHARSAGSLFVCVGAAAAMGMNIEHTLQYLRDRQQFGVSLSTFQALRHYLASAYSKYECYRALVRSVVRQATETGAVGQEDISLLKVYLSHVGPMIAHTVIQVHGGMGMTEALFASRLNKIILMASMEYGDGQFHVGQILDAREERVA